MSGSPALGSLLGVPAAAERAPALAPRLLSRPAERSVMGSRCWRTTSSLDAAKTPQDPESRRKALPRPQPGLCDERFVLPLLSRPRAAGSEKHLCLAAAQNRSRCCKSALCSCRALQTPGIRAVPFPLWVAIVWEIRAEKHRRGRKRDGALAKNQRQQRRLPRRGRPWSSCSAPPAPPGSGMDTGAEAAWFGVPNPLRGTGSPSIRAHSPVPCPGLFRCLCTIGAGSWRGAWRGVGAPRGHPRPTLNPSWPSWGLCCAGFGGFGALGPWGFGDLGRPLSCSCSRRGWGLPGQHPPWLEAELALTPSLASGGSPLPGPSERALLFLLLFSSRENQTQK